MALLGLDVINLTLRKRAGAPVKREKNKAVREFGMNVPKVMRLARLQRQVLIDAEAACGNAAAGQPCRSRVTPKQGAELEGAFRNAEERL
jgi:hypothetical protein